MTEHPEQLPMFPRCWICLQLHPNDDWPKPCMAALYRWLRDDNKADWVTNYQPESTAL